MHTLGKGDLSTSVFYEYWLDNFLGCANVKNMSVKPYTAHSPSWGTLEIMLFVPEDTVGY